jgi:hypothetical protein
VGELDWRHYFLARLRIKGLILKKEKLLPLTSEELITGTFKALAL